MASPDGQRNERKRKLGPETASNCISTKYMYKSESFSVLWTLENYSKIQEKESWFTSPCFYDGAGKNHTWYLGIKPRFAKEGLLWGEDHCLAVSLSFGGFRDSSLNGTKINVRCEISIVNEHGVAEIKKGNLEPNYEPFEYTSGKKEWHSFKDVASSDAIIKNDSPLLVNGSLKLHCRVVIEGLMKQEVHEGGIEPRSKVEGQRVKRRRESFSSELGKFVCSSSFSDFTIKTKTGNIQAHKIILAARSPVFSSIFQANMSQGEEKMSMLDFDSDVVEAMLKYLYSIEGYQIPDGMAIDLLILADKYMIDDLKEECEYVLADNLTVREAAQVLSIAHLCHAEILKSLAVAFIIQNKEAVAQTEGFAQVSREHPQVFADLYMATI